MGLATGNWEWYYPDEGKNSIHTIAGYSQASVSSIQRHANVMGREASAELSMHKDTGDAHIGVVHKGQHELGRRPDLDSVVYLAATDEGEEADGYGASMSIEFGSSHKGRRRKTKGVGALTKATKKMVAKRRMAIT